MTEVSHTGPIVERPLPAWSGLLQALSDFGYALHWANDPVLEGHIRSGMERVREHIAADMLAVAVPQQAATQRQEAVV